MKIMPTLILLHRQIYQAPESVVMKHRVHYRPTILFLTHQSNVIDCSLPLARNHISKNVKPCSYVDKKTSTKLASHILEVLEIFFFTFHFPARSGSFFYLFIFYLFIYILLWDLAVCRNSKKTGFPRILQL